MAKRFTPEEDAQILAMVQEAKAEGYANRLVFTMLEEKLEGRLSSAIEGRYKTLMKNSKGKLSDADKIIAGLRTLNQNNKRNQEKVDVWKSKFDASQKQLKVVQGEYDKLYAEHQAILKTVSDVLGIELSSAQRDQVEQMEAEVH